MVGLLLAAVAGVVGSSNMLVFRVLVNTFVGRLNPIEAYPCVIWFALLGCIMFVASFSQTYILGTASNRQLSKIRQNYFKAILKQDVTWFDTQSTGAIISKLFKYTSHIETGIATKLGEFVQNITGFIAGIVIAFIVKWKLTLVACATLPLTVIALVMIEVAKKQYTSKEVKAYSRALSVSSEILEAIRIVVAYGAEKKELRRYTKELDAAVSMGIHRNTAVGAMVGSVGLSILCSAAVIFWYGVQLIRKEAYDLGSVFLVYINVILGTAFLGSALSCLDYLQKLTYSAGEIYKTIEQTRKTEEEYRDVYLPDFTGNIIFRNVSLSYPTRSDKPVLKNFSLSLGSGTTVALVGRNGSGKSAVIHLLQRFYQPTEGQIKIDGVDIRDIDLKLLRANISCVQRETILFEGTIAENIRMGKLDATQEEVEEAAKLANAHDFILKLPLAYGTLVDKTGGGIPVSLKQLIAIARAIIRKPKILLLDEVTSALDTRSASVVLESLERASVGRTTLLVTDRLTAVRTADLILVLDKGITRESGTHDELVAKNCLYVAMRRYQQQIDRLVEEDEEISGEIRDVKTKSISISENVSQSANEVSESNTTHIGRLFKLSRPDARYIILGCFASAIAGAVQPSFTILFFEFFGIYPKIFVSPDETDRRTTLLCGMMVLLGFIRFFSMLAQGYFFGVSGERFTKRIRVSYFECILRQEIGWFDRPENHTAALTARLATDASQLKVISGSQLNTIVEPVMFAITSAIIGFYYSWRLTLMFFVFFPLIVITGAFKFRSLTRRRKIHRCTTMMEVAQEAITKNRAVFALNLEEFFCHSFNQEVQNSRKGFLRECLLSSLVHAMTQSVAMFAFAAVFGFGYYLIKIKVLAGLAHFRIFAVMNMGAQSLGRTASIGPEAKKALKSARTIFATIDRKSQIPTDEGHIPKESFQGKVTFTHVNFQYPTRDEPRVLKNFSYTVEPGQKVALVGQSGCGKSTLLQLVQRFYDPCGHGLNNGVFFDQWNLRDLAPSWIRKQIGLVSQEPNIFDLTLEENIAYGDDSQDVHMDKIVEVARLLNIHDFISSLPNGYQTMANQLDSHLSNGLKLRIAVSRALLRKPILLLLDEAPFSLDIESNRVLQEALAAVGGSVTSLIVPHRLNCLQESDSIIVVEGGRIIEAGPPATLMAANGAFYSLHYMEQISDR
ncbi:Multidrug resistance protein 2 [Paragonimus heterotremus]|uniref:Multidrug resistance protein 2 n=1 Tax=Paragonimus heterotremus TaxID=100268 RepID=A0A8J4TE06_9TREM|nr:Multidrug resistance protein 2 [Paragonimus heterotremus]